MSDAPETNRDWASAARRWWRALQPYDESGNQNWTGDRGALARLRRASAPADALTEAAVLDLYRQFGFGKLRPDILSHAAITAMTLAHVREDDRGKHPAAAVGRATFADKGFETAAMKPFRFQRLLSARAPDDLVREMRRLVQLADQRINVGQLAADILAWNNDEAGDRVRTRWAYEYLAAGRDAPGADSAPSPSPELAR